MLLHIRYILRLKSAKNGWIGFRPAINTDSVWLSRLCGQDGVLQHRDTFAMSVTVSVDVHNRGGEIIYPMGRVSGIATSFYPWPSKGKIIQALARL